MKRRWAVPAAVFLVLTLTPAGASAREAGPAGNHGPRWEPRWSPRPAVDGLGAFEALEDDRRGSHPEGVPHIFPERNTYKFTSHLVDRDGSDRMRNEVRGMRDRAGRPLEIRKDETW